MNKAASKKLGQVNGKLYDLQAVLRQLATELEGEDASRILGAVELIARARATVEYVKGD